MGAISKNVVSESEGEWCKPTRELKNSKLLKLVHQSRKIITEPVRTDVEVMPQQEDAVVLVNRKPEPPVTDAPEAIVIATVVAPTAEELIERPSRENLDRVALAPFTVDAEGSAAQYPVYRDRLRPLRVAIAVTLPLAAVAAVLFVLLAR
jgi:hypothetical protein